MALFEVTDYDRKVWEEELKDFLPDRILDVHTHVYKKEYFDPVPAYPLPRPCFPCGSRWRISWRWRPPKGAGPCSCAFS